MCLHLYHVTESSLFQSMSASHYHGGHTIENIFNIWIYCTPQFSNIKRNQSQNRPLPPPPIKKQQAPTMFNVARQIIFHLYYFHHLDSMRSFYQQYINLSIHAFTLRFALYEIKQAPQISGIFLEYFLETHNNDDNNKQEIPSSLIFPLPKNMPDLYASYTILGVIVFCSLFSVLTSLVQFGIIFVFLVE